MAVLRMFAQAREVAGTSRVELEATTVGGLLDSASERFGPEFEQVLTVCQVWRNGQPTSLTDQVEPGDEVAVLPPISGG